MRNPTSGTLSAVCLGAAQSAMYAAEDLPERLTSAQEIPYTYKERDLLKFNLYNAYWGTKAYPILMGIVVLTLLVDAALVQAQNLHFLITPALLVVIVNLFLPAHILLDTHREAQTRTHISFSFQKDGFHLTAPYGSLFFHWPEFYKIIGTPRYFYLYFTRKSAVIVPRHLLDPVQKTLLTIHRKQAGRYWPA